MVADDDFLTAIRQDPDNDLPRLIYADWLEEQGNPRCELIRVQCELGMRAKNPLWSDPHPYADGNLWRRQLRYLYPFKKLVRREFDLLKEYGEVWAPQFLPLGKHWHQTYDSVNWNWNFQRGCVEVIRTKCQKLPLALEIIRSTREPVRHLWITVGRHWSESRRGKQIRVVDSGVRILAEAPGLDWIESVHLRYGRIGPTGMEFLVNAKSLHRLRALDLHVNQLGPDGVRILAHSALIGQLKVLDLGHNDIRAAGVRALAESSVTNQLTALNLCSNGLGDEGALVLAESEAFPALERLYLSDNGISLTGCSALLNSPHLPALKMLQLKHNPIPDPDSGAEPADYRNWKVARNWQHCNGRLHRREDFGRPTG